MFTHFLANFISRIHTTERFVLSHSTQGYICKYAYETVAWQNWDNLNVC